MLWTSGPPVADISDLLASEKAKVGDGAKEEVTLPYDICVGVGGVVIAYKKMRGQQTPVTDSGATGYFSFKSFKSLKSSLSLTGVSLSGRSKAGRATVKPRGTM